MVGGALLTFVQWYSSFYPEARAWTMHYHTFNWPFKGISCELGTQQTLGPRNTRCLETKAQSGWEQEDPVLAPWQAHDVCLRWLPSTWVEEAATDLRRRRRMNWFGILSVSSIYHVTLLPVKAGHRLGKLLWSNFHHVSLDAPSYCTRVNLPFWIISTCRFLGQAQATAKTLCQQMPTQSENAEIGRGCHK